MRMTSMSKLALALASVSLFIGSAFGQALSLKSLRANEFGIINAIGKPSIVMLFQPGCSWCKKQEKELSAIHANCPSLFRFRLVGTQGKTDQLKCELHHYQQNIPAYKSTTKFLRQIGGFVASPTTLFFDESGELLGKRRGFLDSSKMSQVINSLTDHKCE